MLVYQAGYPQRKEPVVIFTNFYAIPWIFMKNKSPFILIKFLAEPSWA